MANNDAPRGLQFVTHATSGSNPPMRRGFCAGNTVIRRNQLLEHDTAGLLVGVTDAANYSNDRIVGVSCTYNAGTGAAGDRISIVYIAAPGSTFLIQCSGDFTNSAAGVVTDRDSLLDVMAQPDELWRITGNGTAHSSIASMCVGEIEDTAAGAATDANGIMKVVGWDERPDNEFGANIDVYVRIPGDKCHDSWEEIFNP